MSLYVSVFVHDRVVSVVYFPTSLYVSVVMATATYTSDRLSVGCYLLVSSRCLGIVQF